MRASGALAPEALAHEVAEPVIGELERLAAFRTGEAALDKLVLAAGYAENPAAPGAGARRGVVWRHCPYRSRALERQGPGHPPGAAAGGAGQGLGRSLEDLGAELGRPLGGEGLEAGGRRLGLGRLAQAEVAAAERGEEGLLDIAVAGLAGPEAGARGLEAQA